jgi:hypothetical protein
MPFLGRIADHLGAVVFPMVGRIEMPKARALYNQLAPIRSEHVLWLEIVQTGPRTTAKIPEELGMPC